MSEEKHYPLYDDATLERMMNYFKQHNNDELIRYIKAYGLRRHIDILEENKSG
ncbi:MAG TPA: hypothetical protein VF172_01965 [Nitrososphaera sp.]|jgi:hypothetical protein